MLLSELSLSLPAPAPAPANAQSQTIAVSPNIRPSQQGTRGSSAKPISPVSQSYHAPGGFSQVSSVLHSSLSDEPEGSLPVDAVEPAEAAELKLNEESEPHTHHIHIKQPTGRSQDAPGAPGSPVNVVSL